MNSSQSLPLFEKSCNEILGRLRGDPSPSAEQFVIEANELLTVLEQWKRDTPAQAARSETIMKVMDLYRRVMEWTTKKEL